MPAAAVIPAPIVYINFVAVKKLVVGFRHPARGWFFDFTARSFGCECFAGGFPVLLTECRRIPAGLL